MSKDRRTRQSLFSIFSLIPYKFCQVCRFYLQRKDSAKSSFLNPQNRKSGFFVAADAVLKQTDKDRNKAFHSIVDLAEKFMGEAQQLWTLCPHHVAKHTNYKSDYTK